MAKHAIDQGPISVRVASNVKQLRAKRGMTLDEVAQRLSELGRPMGKSAISKVESGDRRVDVDDLVALALALEVAPNRLLLSATAGEDEVLELSPSRSSSAVQAWYWACGDWIETGGSDVPPFRWFSDEPVTGEREFRFQQESRPQDPPAFIRREDLVQNQSDLDELRTAFKRLVDDGVPGWLLREYARNFTEERSIIVYVDDGKTYASMGGDQG